MQSTPPHAIHNADLLALIPKDAKRVVEVGCMLGAMAREYRQINPSVDYTGIDVDADYAKQAQEHCTRTMGADIETFDDEAWKAFVDCDCWIFGDTLEHLRDPWAVLRRIRSSMAPNGSVVVCIPNAQHWSLVARLAGGIFRYEDSGLLDRTHLRWFTRTTFNELLVDTGFVITYTAERRFLNTMPTEPACHAIKQLAICAGVDPEQAAHDSEIFQYLFVAKPMLM